MRSRLQSAVPILPNSTPELYLYLNVLHRRLQTNLNPNSTKRRPWRYKYLQRADLIRVASAEVNVGTDYEVNIIVTGSPETLRGTAILTELENALEYPTVLFDDRRFMNIISRSNGITIIIGNHDHIASWIDLDELT